MLELSRVLVDIVKQYDRDKTKAICLTASHRGTSGATLKTSDKHGFTCEEDLFRVVVREAVDRLNFDGWTNVDQAGLDEHEMNLGQSFYGKYSLIISNHFDASADNGGKKATLYTNESLAKSINDIRNSLTAPLGIAPSTLSHRPDLYMTNMNNCVLLEWFAGDDEYDVNVLLSPVGKARPETPQPPKKEYTISYSVFKAYPELGRFTCNVPEGIASYKDVQLAERASKAEDLETGEYTNYDHVYYIAASDGKGYVVVRSATSGNFFPIRTFEKPDKFGSKWGTIS